LTNLEMSQDKKIWSIKSIKEDQLLALLQLLKNWSITLKEYLMIRLEENNWTTIYQLLDGDKKMV
jgi:hypothetical protein